MSHAIDTLVPKGPPDLCFESAAFTKESFSVDQFLQDHRTGGNLETMRDDLGIYLKVLRSAMIDLINKDYADYVNLSRNLIGLDKAIGSINAPLGQLKEELLQVNQYIDNAIADVTVKLERRKALRERKRSLRSLSRVQLLLNKLQVLLGGGPVDGDVVERAVAEFSQLQFNSDRCFHLMSEQERQSYREIGDVLYRNINSLFVEFIRGKDSGKSDLCRCLTFYLKMNKQHDVERFYRDKVVSQAMKPLITRETLRSLHRGLPALYEKILSYVDNDMKHILQVTHNNDKYPGLNVYDFLLRSFWPEVEQRLEINLTSIYDAGDPDIFFSRYTETMVFLNELGQRFKSDKARMEWENQESFSSFMKKWNVAVYFQIRFQEIVKGVESALQSAKCVDEVRGGAGVAASTGTSSDGWKLEISRSLWSSIARCWDPSVFLLVIADKFWKLSLQIVARYHTWVRDILKNKVPSLKTESSNSWRFLVYIYSDVETLVKRMPELGELALGKMPSISQSTKDSLTKSFEESGKCLSGELASIERGIVNCVSCKCSVYLRQVSDIPRLYRRTNKPCPYVLSLLEPTMEFANNHSDIPATNLWLQTLFSDLTKQYYRLVSEVLTSVQKTEESLRRLKKARDNRSQMLPPQQRTADDDKIRLQLLIDVTAYSNGIIALGIKKNSVEQLNYLLLLVETTQKI